MALISSAEPECYKRHMHPQTNLLLALICTCLTLGGCTSLSGANTAQASPQTELSPALYLAQDNFYEKLQELSELELRAMALAADEPLALGPLGSTLIENNPASLTGHHALVLFYQHVEADAAAAKHQQLVDRLTQQILATGDGSVERPYRVLSRADARLIVAASGEQLVGGVYQSNASMPLQLLLLSRLTRDTPVQSTYFDLSGLVVPQAGNESNPWDVLRILADSEDTAAQAAIGTYLARQRRYDPAVRWLELAAREDNLLAHTLLARIYWYQSGLAESSEGSAPEQSDAKSAAELIRLAVDNHIVAMGLGSTESMYAIARLLLEDPAQADAIQSTKAFVAPERRTAGAIELLEKAGALGFTQAYLYLASQFQQGAHVEADEQRANDYFAKAAGSGDSSAVIGYARYVASDPNRQVKIPLIRQLNKLAESDNAEAMLVLGNLYAKGVSVRPSARKAVRWYKKAVDAAQASHHGNAAVVNEVAWTLAVTDVKGLQQPGYAQTIMDALMKGNKQVQSHPEYLDTWAATYAANGNFARAIELQRRALEVARTQERTDVIDILETHLAFFEAGNHIIDKTP